MYRYAEEALILCPAYECYTNKADTYYINMRRSLANIVAFLKSKDITPCMLASDEVANIEDPEGVKWYQTFTTGDKLFVKKYCGSIKADRDDFLTVPDLYAKALKQFPMAKHTNPELAFDDVLKRTAKIERELIKRFKVIFTIQTKNNASYNIKPKEGSEVILVQINNGNFLPETYLGNMMINPIDLLDYSLGNRPTYEWRV